MRELDPVECRVLGVLVEKQMTTPNAYPLTLAGVVSGANQSTNRDPVMALDEREVESVLVRLHDLQLATPVRRSGDRATKFRHKLAETLELKELEVSVLAVLMLRGAQTSGELRQRTDRYVDFESADAVDRVIDTLIEKNLAVRLEREPGQSQRRLRQLLGEAGLPVGSEPDIDSPDLEGRLSQLERRFAELLYRLGEEDL